MTTQLFTRGWKMLRADGTRGALCEITPPTDESIADAVRKLRRLQEWAEYFAIPTCLDEVIDWVESGPYPHAAMFNQEFDPEPGFFGGR